MKNKYKVVYPWKKDLNKRIKKIWILNNQNKLLMNNNKLNNNRGKIVEILINNKLIKNNYKTLINS
jgi:hypothetical protein